MHVTRPDGCSYYKLTLTLVIPDTVMDELRLQPSLADAPDVSVVEASLAYYAGILQFRRQNEEQHDHIMAARRARTEMTTPEDIGR